MDEDSSVKKAGIGLLLETARHTRSECFHAIIDSVEAAVWKANDDSIRCLAMRGIASLLASTFVRLPFDRPKRLFQLIVAAVRNHASPLVRHCALSALGRLRANSKYQMQWYDSKVRTSGFLYCAQTRCPAGAESVDMRIALEAIVHRIEEETDGTVLLLSLKILLGFLHNRFILDVVPLDDLCAALCQIVVGRLRLHGASNKDLTSCAREDRRGRALADRTHFALFWSSGNLVDGEILVWKGEDQQHIATALSNRGRTARNVVQTENKRQRQRRRSSGLQKTPSRMKQRKQQHDAEENEVVDSQVRKSKLSIWSWRSTKSMKNAAGGLRQPENCDQQEDGPKTSSQTNSQTNSQKKVAPYFYAAAKSPSARSSLTQKKGQANIVRSRTMPAKSSTSQHSIENFEESIDAMDAMLDADQPRFATVTTVPNGSHIAGPSIDELMRAALEILCTLVGYVPRLSQSSTEMIIDCFCTAISLVPITCAASPTVAPSAPTTIRGTEKTMTQPAPVPREDGLEWSEPVPMDSPSVAHDYNYLSERKPRSSVTQSATIEQVEVLAGQAFQGLGRCAFSAPMKLVDFMDRIILYLQSITSRTVSLFRQAAVAVPLIYLVRTLMMSDNKKLIHRLGETQTLGLFRPLSYFAGAFGARVAASGGSIGPSISLARRQHIATLAHRTITFCFARCPISFRQSIAGKVKGDISSVPVVDSDVIKVGIEVGSADGRSAARASSVSASPGASSIANLTSVSAHVKVSISDAAQIVENSSDLKISESSVRFSVDAAAARNTLSSQIILNNEDELAAGETGTVDEDSVDSDAKVNAAASAVEYISPSVKLDETAGATPVVASKSSKTSSVLLLPPQERELAVVTRDFIDCFMFANFDRSSRAQMGGMRKEETFFPSEDETAIKTWIQHESITSVETSISGIARIIIRRPCGVMRWTIHIGNDRIAPHIGLPFRLGRSQHPNASACDNTAAAPARTETRESVSGKASDHIPGGEQPQTGFSDTLPTSATTVATSTTTTASAKQTTTTALIGDNDNAGIESVFEVRHEAPTATVLDPSYLLFQLRDIAGPGCILLQPSDALDRALAVLDRTPFVHTHKIGVIYVGAGQKTETEILGNQDGSPQFLTLLMALGEFVRLEDCSANGYYTGGLDCETGSDGEYGLLWKDDGCHMMFHVAVMMPSVEDVIVEAKTTKTMNLHNKKRHVGNDYVHIVYSDNEDSTTNPYLQDTIAGQFNFVHVVVRPMGEDYFSVEVLAKEELREVGVVPTCQIVPARVLREVVRDIALRADLACKVFHQQQGGCGQGENQLERLKQIRRIESRLGGTKFST